MWSGTSAQINGGVFKAPHGMLAKSDGLPETITILEDFTADKQYPNIAQKVILGYCLS